MSGHGELPTSARMHAARQAGLRRSRLRLRLRIAAGVLAAATLVSFVATLGQPGV
jgi:hypothetical protein